MGYSILSTLTVEKSPNFEGSVHELKHYFRNLFEKRDDNLKLYSNNSSRGFYVGTDDPNWESSEEDILKYIKNQKGLVLLLQEIGEDGYTKQKRFYDGKVVNLKQVWVEED